MRTLVEPIEGTDIRIEPATESDITVNGTPATLDHVCKADRRVDITDGEDRSFIVEHALAPLGLHGVTAATITGVRDAWSFDRPEHRFCYSTTLTPGHVVGHPAGLPNPAIAEALTKTAITGTIEERRTVDDPVEYSTEDGHIQIEPAAYGTGLVLDVTLGPETYACTVDPTTQNEPSLVETITTATTPYLDPPAKEAVRHAIADLVADIGVIGGFDDLNVTADLGGPYHALTIGVVRRARDRGIDTIRVA